MNRFALLLTVVCAMSCSETSAERGPSKDELPPPRIATLDEEIRAQGSVIFRSWDGRWRGTDIDTDIQFLPANRVKVVEYGEGVETYRGTYKVSDDGEVGVALVDYRGSCPVMLVRRDSRSLLLLQKDPGLKPAIRDRFTVLSDLSPGFWPFRQIPAGERSRFHD
jgi:hypothetical protein